jgi:hypothetical protein
VLVEVLRRRRASQLVTELAQLANEVGRLCEPARDEPRLAFRFVPALEMLYHGLRVDRRLRVGLELAHGR